MDSWPRVIILVDADAFFAAVEIRDNPSLKGKPVIVGARPGERGVVSTCSYEARKYGVRSAMPISQAYRLCPHGVYLTPDGEKYGKVSRAMFEIFYNYTPIVEMVSVDEGYLDVTPERGDEIAAKIRQEVRNSLGITVTAGVSYCRYLAKIAAEENKPDGLGVISPGEALGFLERLPVSKLPGVGPKTLKVLHNHGIVRVGDLRTLPPHWFESTLGKYGARLRELSLGIDTTPVGQKPATKSVSEETTFEIDQTDSLYLHYVLARLSQDVGFRLRRHNYSARTIGIKVRFSNFTTLTREKTLPDPVSSDKDIYASAKSLLDRLELPMAVRLLGVSASGIVQGATFQPPLLNETNASWDRVTPAIDDLRLKYGKGVINLGAAVKPPK